MTDPEVDVATAVVTTQEVIVASVAVTRTRYLVVYVTRVTTFDLEILRLYLSLVYNKKK